MTFKCFVFLSTSQCALLHSLTQLTGCRKRGGVSPQALTGLPSSAPITALQKHKFYTMGLLPVDNLLFTKRRALVGLALMCGIKLDTTRQKEIYSSDTYCRHGLWLPEFYKAEQTWTFHRMMVHVRDTYTTFAQTVKTSHNKRGIQHLCCSWNIEKKFLSAVEFRLHHKISLVCGFMTVCIKTPGVLLCKIWSMESFSDHLNSIFI